MPVEMTPGRPFDPFGARPGTARRFPLLLFLLINSVYFFSCFQRVAVPGTLFNELQTAFHLSASAVATLGTLYFYIYGGMQFVAGVLVDTFGGARVLLAGGTLLALGSLLFPLSTSTAPLFSTRAVVGLGAGVIYVSVLKELHARFEPRRFPALLGSSIFLGYSGGLAATYPLERLTTFFGWRAALLAAAALNALGVAAAAAHMAGKTRENRCGYRDTPGRFRIVLPAGSAPLAFSGAMNYSLYFLFQATIGKKFLEDFCGMRSPVAAGFTFAMMLVCMILSATLGFLSSRSSPRRETDILVGATLSTFLALLTMLAGVLLRLPGTVFLACYGTLGLSSAAGILFTTVVKERAASDTVGTAIGFFNGICYLCVAVTTNLAGIVLDSFRGRAVRLPGAIVYPAAAYGWILSGCCVLAALSFLASLRIRKGAAFERPRGNPGILTAP